MPQAIVDPEELRQFAQSLKKFNNTLRERAMSLANQLAALNATWRDQEHKKFVEQFDTNMKVLLRFTETADLYVPYLLRKAEHIEDYLQSQRPHTLFRAQQPMAARAANISSINAVRLMKGALAQFAEEVQIAIVALEMESRRPVEWVEHDRTQYWPREEQRAGNEVMEARLALQRCELTVSGDTRYCYDERKLLEKAKRRQRTCEAKVQAVKRWRIQLRKEVEEFQVHMEKLRHYLDADFVRSLAALDRMAAALDQYTQTRGPAGPASAGIEPAALGETAAGPTIGEPAAEPASGESA